ncbi:MAG TPA: hypothetical protein VJB67_01375 [Patescibacteria group bacterium]|nr:hypothetical protein [Patescibacteria group bacterium]
MLAVRPTVRDVASEIVDLFGGVIEEGVFVGETSHIPGISPEQEKWMHICYIKCRDCVYGGTCSLHCENVREEARFHGLEVAITLTRARQPI